MIKQLERKIEELKAKRENIKKYVEENKNNPEMQDLVNIAKGQAIELLEQIRYLKQLVLDFTKITQELKGE